MLVSIVMAVYNGEIFLQEALNSLLAQTYPNIELIIVNDGSTDSTQAILDKIVEQRVKVIHLAQNQGAAHALNTGIKQAKGSWIAIQDADDRSYPTRIAEQVKYLAQHPHLVGVGTLVEYIPGKTAVSDNLLKKLTKIKNSIVSREEIRKSSYYICHLTHSSIMFAKDIFWEAGGYNPEFKILYDYDLWLRLLEKGDMEKVPQILLQYRIHQNSLSRKNIPDTVNEIQTASAKAIARLFLRNKQPQPKFILIGPKKAGENYRHYIAPASGLKIQGLIYENWKKQVPLAIKSIKAGRVAGIILLDCYHRDKILSHLLSCHLKLNEQVFNIYNII